MVDAAPSGAQFLATVEDLEANMKVAIGMRPYAGPWGGGNRFVTALAEALGSAGHDAVHDLASPDIDILLLIDPRLRAPNVTFSAGGMLRYLALRNPRALAVHRVNECDERKGEPFINHHLVRANYCADATVFVGAWLTRLPVWQRHLREPWYVVRNGADERTFHARGFAPWRGHGPLRLVTHHWGYHEYKGFDVYRALDGLLEDPAWSDRIAFTYVGNLPAGFTFRNARHVPPLDGETLASELRSHHAYVTGSIGEPGGNHQNEGALCGLPLVYRDSGCLPEYCDDFGIAFAGPEEITSALEQLIRRYSELVVRMINYPHTATRMAQEWIAVLEDLDSDRGRLVARRRLWRSPGAALRSCLPF